MNDRRRERGAVLIMSLIFLLLLSIVAAALLDTVASQTRLGVVQQQARSLFQVLNGALASAGRRQAEIRQITLSAQPGMPMTWHDDETEMEPPEGSRLTVELLRPGYACQVTGYSSGSCLPVELRGDAEQSATHAGSHQVQGLLVETINVSSGGDSRAGIFNGSRSQESR